MDFASRHIGPRADDIQRMLSKLNKKSVTELINGILPSSIRQQENLDLPDPLSEKEFIEYANVMAADNQKFRSTRPLDPPKPDPVRY